MNRMRDNDDNVLTDLSFKGAYELNSLIEISPNINYFCYTSDGITAQELKPKNIRFPFLKPLGRLIAKSDLPDKQFDFIIDDSWRKNDGLVNTPSALNPVDEPSKEFDGTVEPGIWNIMPTLCGDHGQAAGLLADKKTLHSFYENLADMLISIEKQ